MCLTRLLFGARVSLTTAFCRGGMLGADLRHIGGRRSQPIARGRIEGDRSCASTISYCAFRRSFWHWRSRAALGIGALNTMIAMLVVWWPKFARLAHSLVLVQRSQEYVEAATVMGFGPGTHSVAAHHSELDRPADRAGHARSRQRHHDLCRAFVSGTGRGAADAGMGIDGGRRPRAGAAVVGRNVSRASPS